MKLKDNTFHKSFIRLVFWGFWVVFLWIISKNKTLFLEMEICWPRSVVVKRANYYIEGTGFGSRHSCKTVHLFIGGNDVPLLGVSIVKWSPPSALVVPKVDKAKFPQLKKNKKNKTKKKWRLNYEVSRIFHKSFYDIIFLLFAIFYVD